MHKITCDGDCTVIKDVAQRIYIIGFSLLFMNFAV